MIKKIVAVAMTALMAFTFSACADKEGASDNINNSTGNMGGITSEFGSGEIELLRQDSKLTQEQVLSRIKAEKLIENKGYKDDDAIKVMVKLPETSLVESFNSGANATFGSVAEYSKSSAGIIEKRAINARQESVVSELKAKGLIDSVEYRYNTVTNAIAVTAKYGNLEKIKSVTGVENVYISDTYNRPQAISVDEVNSIVNDVDVYDTGIFNSGVLPQYTGDGTAVAVLDSGFDCSHSVFQNSNITKPVLTTEKIGKSLAGMNASDAEKGSPDVAVSDVYYSVKIPFKYDYADKDSDVFPYDSEHGTHVAGIIGGYDREDKEGQRITGIAINTQMVLMKVFPDLDEGAETDDILAALEDAMELGVDAINMSLGSSCGFAREVDKVWINDVYDALKVSGISVITAASNSYSSGFGGEQGNTNMVSNPDSATVGSPSTYEACLSVASISGVKSRYLIGNDEQVLFFDESNNVSGKPNNFVEELGLKEGETKTFEYLTVPGSGLAINYSGIKNDIKGKIALVRRGDNTFEEKAQIAKEFGAVACIIYNNIDGDILMSMGKSDHIPTVSISKDDGTKLASKDRGTLKIGYNQAAGPFMSDFSSWGPTPSLGIKPEITAHGGNITSSVPGGGYDTISGTSMASPNLCGIVVLIRQYLKDTYPEMTALEYSKLCNSLLMSTATIIKNEEGNPYSPRKQGAGLASLKNAVKTKALIEVDGTDRPKFELGDDKKKNGVYTLEFTVRNLSADTLRYDVSLDSMTESVSSSDKNHVAEKAYMLGGNTSVTLLGGDASLDGATLTVNGRASAKVKVVYTMTAEDKNYITQSFPYGMYVEGFLKLTAKDANEISLSAPYLAFFGDWTEAPLFDKTYYEVESEAHDGSIDEEDKLKADYFATTPYGSYFYNYIIPLGTYLYDLDETVFEAIPATEEHIAISDMLGTIDGISAVYAGLLRNAKEMHFTITDKLTGEVVYDYYDYNANKAFSQGGSPIPYYDFLKINSQKIGLVNNRQYEFRMQGKLDYGEDGGLSTNVRNFFAFDFYLDNEAPIIKEATYEKVYDKTQKKDRYYITLTVYDNQYVQSITPVAFTSTSSYTFLSENPIPVYSNKGADNKVRFEITDYLDALYSDALVGSALAFSIDDYALNSNIFLCQLPGTRGEFRFTSNGDASGRPLSVLTAYVGDVVDLTDYLYSEDKTLDADKDYLKYLTWTAYNTSIIKADPVTKQFKNGEAVCLKAGKTQVTVVERMDGLQATITLNVKEREASAVNGKASADGGKNKTAGNGVKKNAAKGTADDATLQSLDFVYFDTLFAYKRAAQTSDIGDTGDRKYVSEFNGGVSFYPGEKIKLTYAVEPWYIEDRLKLEYTTSNDKIVKVEQDGTVTALKEGSALITLVAENSNIRARIKVTVKSEFVIENRTLIAYKGLGGHVEIPDDEGILYIGPYAFCLYDTDRSVELDEDDYDANKIPAMNTSVTSVTVPHGVEEIQKYAFYNCSGLREVTLPSTVKFIREYSFYNDEKLTYVHGLGSAEMIGAYAFHGCKVLAEADLGKCYSLGASAFEGCSALTEIDLTHLRNAAEAPVKGSGEKVGRTFKDCTSLATIILGENTKLCREMFVNTAVETLDIYERNSIPVFAFAKNPHLKKVTFHNPLLSIGLGAFCQNPLLDDVVFKGSVGEISSQAFYADTKLTAVRLPDGAITLGEYCFRDSGLKVLTLSDNTELVKIGASAFDGTSLGTFAVTQTNAYYATEADGALLTSKDGKQVILAAIANDFGDYTLPEKYEKIASGAFSGANITSIVFANPDIVIGAFAFNECTSLTAVIFPDTVSENATVGERAFNGCAELATVVNLDKLKNVDKYGFANTGLREIVIGAGAQLGEGAFFQSKVEKLTVGANSSFGMGSFQRCTLLETVVMPDGGNVHFGADCFAYCTSLTSIDLSKTDKIIEAETFYGCTSLMSVNLDKVTSVGAYAFADCARLSGVINAMSLKEIGDGAFSRATERGTAPIFEAIALDSVETIGDGAFMGCAGLSEITLPDTLTKIPDFAFSFNVNLRKVTLPETVTEIGQYAFRGCENLESVNLANVRKIGDYAFYGAGFLVTANLASAETIGDGAFTNTSLVSPVIAPELVSVGSMSFAYTRIALFTAPKLKTVGERAFYKNTALMKFGFGADIEKIDSMAFLGCSSLTTFYFTEEGVEMTTGEINGYASLYKGVLYTKMPSGKLELKSVPAALNTKTLTVKDGTVRIDTYAGNRNNIITKIVLPDTLRLIGNYAFNGYKNLAEVEFKSFEAPALETQYYSVKDETDFFPKAELSEDAPGYGLLHNQFDLFGYELYYFTFRDLAGSFKPIKMTLASNASLTGYKAPVFEACFGKADAAKKSEHVAPDTNTTDFIDYAEQIKKLEKVTLSDAKLINNAVASLNAMKQSLTDFGYTQEQADALIKAVRDAKSSLTELQVASAGRDFKNLLTKINGLSDTFSAKDIATLRSVSNEITALTAEERMLLKDTAQYAKYLDLTEQYKEYCNAILPEGEEAAKGAVSAFAYAAAAIAATVSVAAAAAFALRKRIGL